MNAGNEKVAYVVFKGRVPGIYTSWPACAAQVDGYKGNQYKGYYSYHHAEAEWRAHCMETNHLEDSNCMHKPPLFEAGSSSQSASNMTQPMAQGGHVLQRMASHIAEDTDSDEFLLQHSAQAELQLVCNELGLHDPTYSLHEVTHIVGLQYQRYYASVVSKETGRAIVAVGRFGKTVSEALEDAAASLLQRVMSTTGKKIRDYNHYNVELLEEELSKSIDQKFELEMEISILNEEIRMMNVNARKK